jgi:hypothetical protein
MLRNGELIFTLVIVSVSMARLRMFARLRWRFAHWNLFHDGRSGLYASTMPEPRRRFCDSRHALSLIGELSALLNQPLHRRHASRSRTSGPPIKNAKL